MFPFWHRILRWFLHIDRPVPSRTYHEMVADVLAHYRWNFMANLLDGATFWFGLSFISSSTIVPLFISKLSDSPFPVGLAAVIAQGAWFFPQLFTANFVERLPWKKPVAVNLGLFLERVPLWVIVAAAIIAGRSPTWALVFFLFGYAWHGLGAGVVATAWQDLYAASIPVERRGILLGLTTFIGTGMGTLGAGLSGWILTYFAFPLNFVYTFTIAAIGITLSWVFLALIYEPAQVRPASRPEQHHFRRELADILNRDHNFRRFLVARLLLAIGGMGSGFITVAAVQIWGVSDATVANYTAAMLIGQTAGNLLFGLLADRWGHKLPLELGALAGVIAYGLAWLAPSPTWYYLVFGLQGVILGAIITSGILVVMEFSPADRRPTYTGLTNTLLGLTGGGAPLLGVWLARFGYQWLFVLSAILCLVSWLLMHWWVKEPRWVNNAD